jgi:hypothetical protein
VQNGVAFAPAQTQTYTVTGVDATGCQNTATVTVTVNPAPAVSGGVNQNVCAGASVTLNGSGAATYVWSNNVQNGVAFTPTLTQTYSVIGTDANGCIDTAQVTVVVYSLPNVGAGQNQTVCEGTSVTLNGSGATSYSWNNNVQNNVPFTATQTTTYTVTGTNGVGCTNTAQVTVTVNPLPAVSGGLNQAVCAGNSVTLTGSGANTYAWNNNVQNGVAFTPTSTQTYIVTGTNANGCIDTAQVVVTVNQLPVVSGGPNTTVCAGDSATLNGSGASTYAWNNGITNGVTFIPNSTMTYTVTGTDANGCQDTAQVTLTVSPLPSVSAGEDSTVCDYNFPIVISAQGNPSLSYSWSNGITAQQTTITTGGTYTVTATNPSGCSSSDAIVITADPCAGLLEEGIEMSLFPNPFTNEVTLVCNSSIDAAIEVFSTEGKLIAKEDFHGNQHVLSLNTLANGTYTVRIAQSETVRIFKIVKQ